MVKKRYEHRDPIIRDVHSVIPGNWYVPARANWWWAFCYHRKLLKIKIMIDTILAIAIPLIAIVIVIWAILNFTWYFYDLPVKRIRAIAERNGKGDPYNWVFATWFLSWTAVLLYWIFNERNKNMGRIFQSAGKYKFVLFIILLLLLSAGWFYWFQVRPAEIRKECSKWRSDVSYLNCIRKQGLER